MWFYHSETGPKIHKKWKKLKTCFVVEWSGLRMVSLKNEQKLSVLWFKSKFSGIWMVCLIMWSVHLKIRHKVSKSWMFRCWAFSIQMVTALHCHWFCSNFKYNCQGPHKILLLAIVITKPLIYICYEAIYKKYNSVLVKVRFQNKPCLDWLKMVSLLSLP